MRAFGFDPGFRNCHPRCVAFADRCLKALCIGIIAVGCEVVLSAQSFDADAGLRSRLLRLEIQPATPLLFGTGAQQQLLVSGHYSDGNQRDLSREVRFTSQRPQVAAVDGKGLVTAHQQGLTGITARLGRLRSSVRALVVERQQDNQVQFIRDILPVLTLKGCNSGNCHGSMHGKNGFKLSQFGYDPRHDYKMIARGACGRRVNLREPARSLVLLKPTSTIPHGGGTRFATDSSEYRMLAEWIAQGAPGPNRSWNVEVERLEVIPEDWVMARAEMEQQQQQMVVLAHYTDRTVKDVTRTVKYLPKDSNVVSVNASGLVKAQRPGETSILVQASGTVGVARVAVLANRPIRNYPPVRSHNFVDELIFAKLRRLHVIPSELCSDEVFLRRAFLDVIGVLPTADEVQSFLADEDPGKRAKLIDALLARPEYADYWGLIWADLLTVTAFKSGPSRTLILDQWIRDRLRENIPMDRFATQLIAGTGSAKKIPGLSFVVSRPPEQIASYFSQLFLGVRIQCAQCHDHPFEKWTRNDYFGMVAFFGQVKTRGSKLGTLVYDDPEKELTNPVTGKPAVPQFIGSDPVPRENGASRRARLAEWVTSPDNPYFARAISNRIWKHFMGVGLVEPVDDFRETNPPTNPELLDGLAAQFVRNGYDLKHLMKTIMNSRVYQLSSETNRTNESDKQNYSHHYVRRIYAEPLLDAVTQVTGVPHIFRFGYPGMKAVELHDPVIPDAFLQTFDRNRRETICEREENITLLQTMTLISGEAISEKVRFGGGTVDQLLKSARSDREIIEELYLRAMGRYPSPEETSAILEVMKERQSRTNGFQDLLWALLNSREFLFKY